MGVVEAKLTVKKDEPPLPHPPPPTTTTKFMETTNEELARMKMEEKPAEAASDQEMAAIADDAGPDQALESPRKVEAKGNGPRFPQRPDEPDCAFYMKMGTCKFGMNCKFNHPPKRREQWAKLKKQSEDGQTVEEKRGEPGTKMMRQTTRKVDEKETKVGKFVEKDKKVGKADEKEKKIAKNNFRQENAGGKQKGPLRQVEQTETKVVNKNHLPPRTEHKDNKNGKEKQGSCGRLEQKDNKVFNKEHLGPRTDHKDDEASKDKQNSWGRLELDIGAAKQSRKERTSEKIEVRECKFHTMPGGCKFGKSCKYVHSQTKTEVAPLELNFLGLPIRPGAKKCSYYMRTGNCKFATNCKYHHPDPTEVTVGQDPLPFHGYQNRGPPIANLQPIAVEVSPVHVMSNVTHATRQGPTSFEVASPYYAGTSLDPEVFHSNWQSGTH